MAVEKQAGPRAGDLSDSGRVAVIGAGLIGSAWAHVFARAGWYVQVWDPSAAQREAVLPRVEQWLRDGAAYGLVADADAATRRVQVVDSIEAALTGADYVQESGPENLDTKTAVFAQLDALAAPATVLASSTSALVASRFTERLPGRARCLVAHPVNPPHLAPVVEVCGASSTRSAVPPRRNRSPPRAAGAMAALPRWWRTSAASRVMIDIHVPPLDGSCR